ncbi:MAG: formyltransferase family protein [Pseudomonadota bacterium]|nr:formyltransferase family protein [Pseudomonadota bacterium]
MDKSKRISFLVDNDSWITPYVLDLKAELKAEGFDACFEQDISKVKPSDICFLLGCVNIVPASFLVQNRNNIVVHSSALPQGKGFAPMAWQILEGKNEITFTLFEAVGAVDAGDIWLQDTLQLEGHELCSEWRHLQGKKVAEMCKDFVTRQHLLQPYPQKGEESFYTRRRPKDSQLDVHKTIAEQFNLLRVVDNELYPAFFELNGVKYKLKIEKDEQ